MLISETVGPAGGSVLPILLTGDSYTFVWGLLEFSTVLGRARPSRKGFGSGQYWKTGVWRSDSRLVCHTNWQRARTPRR